MGTVKAVFGVDDINIKNINDLKIEDISAGKKYGRRFQIKNGDLSSDEVIFKDIYNRVKTLASEEKKNPENPQSLFGDAKRSR